MTRILSADILIADVILPLKENPQLSALVEKHQMKPGGKAVLNDEQLKEFTEATAGCSATIVPGGSSANMLTTLCKLMGKEIEVRFLGVTGDGPYSGVINESLDEAGITLLPERHSPLSQVAVSFVFVSPDGQCTIATHPGNAHDILKPAMIAEHLVKNSDVLLAQGSLWHKLHEEFASRLHSLCVKHGRQLWLTLPTQAKLSSKESEKFKSMVPDASLVLGNESELVRIYDSPLDSALARLQKALREKEVPESGDARLPIGFITLGKEGAAVVAQHSIDYIPSVEISEGDIVNTLGAGDTAFAGFAAGYIKNLPDAKSARIAMTLAGKKLRINGPRLHDPRAILQEAAPDLAQLL